MRLFISTPSGLGFNLAANLQRVARLYQRGVLDADSSVWINADAHAPVMWALTSRTASCLFFYDAPTSGTVRLTKDRIRWAPTYNTSGSEPSLDISLSALPVDDIRHVTFVVAHANREEPVQVVESVRRYSLSGGFWHGNYAAVVDLPTFTPSAPPESGVSKFVESLAHIHGADLLTRGMSRADAKRFEESVDDHAVDLSADTLGALCTALDAFAEVSRSCVDTVLSRQSPVAV